MEIVNVNLVLIIFKQDNNMVVYCPALDLSGYGTNESEAEKSFKTVLSEYFRYTLNKDTLKADLQKLGWKSGNKRKLMTPPSMEKLLKENDNFKTVFNQYDFRKTVTPVDLPAIA